MAASLESLAIYRKRPENKYANVRASESSVCDITEMQSAHAPKSNYGSERRAQATNAVSDYLRNIALAQDGPAPKSAKTTGARSSKSSKSQKSLFALEHEGDVITLQQQANDDVTDVKAQREVSDSSQQLPDSSATTYLPPKPVPPNLKPKSNTRRKQERITGSTAALHKYSSAAASGAPVAGAQPEHPTVDDVSTLPPKAPQNGGLTARRNVNGKQLSREVTSRDLPPRREWRVQAETAKAEVQRHAQAFVDPPSPRIELTPRQDDIMKQIGGARSVLPVPASRRFNKSVAPTKNDAQSPSAAPDVATALRGKRPWARQLESVMAEGGSPALSRAQHGGANLTRGRLGRSDGFLATNTTSPTRGETSSRLSAMKNINDTRGKHTSDSTWRIYQQLRVHRQ